MNIFGTMPTSGFFTSLNRVRIGISGIIDSYYCTQMGEDVYNVGFYLRLLITH